MGHAVSAPKWTPSVDCPGSVTVTLPRAKMAGNKGGLPCGTTHYFSVVRQTSWHQGCWQYNSSKIGISIRMTLERAAMGTAAALCGRRGCLQLEESQMVPIPALTPQLFPQIQIQVHPVVFFPSWVQGKPTEIWKVGGSN